MTAFTLLRDGAALRGTDTGAGPHPVLFQHGLGGGEAQAAENFPDGPGLRRLTLECRGHGGSAAGDVRPFSLALFAEDLVAALAARGVARVVAGGISMGAALALRLAVRHPERIAALVLVRPAWAFEAAPVTLRPYAEVADLLARHPPADARARFSQGATARRLAREAPDNLASLLGFFDRPDPATTAALLADIAADGPGVAQAEAAALRLPALVVGNAIDHAHPLALAATLAEALPGAQLVTVPPKATDKPGHRAAVRAAISGFLARLDPDAPPPRNLPPRNPP